MKVHPVFVLGIILVAAPSLAIIFGWTLWGWIMKLGIGLILIGAVLSAVSGGE